jgi:hypothetical protein
MKKTLLFLTVLVFGTNQLWASQYTVSNAIGGAAQFTTIQSAIDSAQPNDTILVQGSTINYGDFNITKALTIIGPGHHPTAIGAFSSTTGNCSISPVASGTRLIGLDIFAISIGGVTPVDNFIVRNCIIRNNMNFQNSTTNCVFEGNFIYASIQMYDFQGMEMIFRNNVFFHTSVGPRITNINSPIIFDHNTFLGTSSGRPFNVVYQAIISNNIFYNCELTNTGSLSTSYNGCVVINNATYLCAGSLPGANNTGSGNLNGVDPLFVNYPAIPTDFSWLYDIHLQPSSSLLEAGSDGTQIGVYGGTYPFRLSGEPIGMPSMNTLTIDNVAVPLNGTLNVNFSAEQAE